MIWPHVVPLDTYLAVILSHVVLVLGVQSLALSRLASFCIVETYLE